MTVSRHISRHIVFVVTILLVIGLKVTTARGRRGGGGSRFGARFRSSGRFRTGETFGGDFDIDTDSDSYSDTYQICQNNNINVSESVSVYGKFYCPMSNQPSDYTYCCGESGNQRCCRYADDPGRLAGLIGGIFFGIIVNAAWIGFCLCRKKMCGRKESEDSANPPNQLTLTPAAPPYAIYPNGTAPYGYPQAGVYPQTGEPGYPTPYPASETLAYDKSDGLSHSPNPTGTTEALPYSANPVGLVQPNLPNNSHSDPDSTEQRDKPEAPRYSPNPDGFVKSSVPNSSYSDPNPTDRNKIFKMFMVAGKNEVLAQA